MSEQKITDWSPYKKKAEEVLSAWLSHENELGKVPKAIEVAEDFDHESGHAFVIKYKENLFSKWLLGVCVLDEYGEDCGLNFSEFEPYNPKTAKEKSLQLISYLQEYWKGRFLAELDKYGVTEEEYRNMTPEEWEQKKKEVDNKQRAASQGFVLLNTHTFDLEKLMADLKKDWGLEPEEFELSQDAQQNLVFNWDHNLMAVSLMDMPIPEGEAEHFAAGNYMWKEAVEVTKTHVAHLLVFAINHENNPLDAAKRLSKVVSSCLNQQNAIGVYAGGTVHQPAFYKEASDLLKKDELPLLLWIYFGFGKSAEGNDGYTYGLKAFGKSEIEVIDSKASFDEIRSFLYMVSSYLLTSGMTFYNGETLSFAAGCSYTVTKSKAVYVDGDSFKIPF